MNVPCKLHVIASRLTPCHFLAKNKSRRRKDEFDLFKENTETQKDNGDDWGSEYHTCALHQSLVLRCVYYSDYMMKHFL